MTQINAHLLQNTLGFVKEFFTSKCITPTSFKLNMLLLYFLFQQICYHFNFYVCWEWTLENIKQKQVPRITRYAISNLHFIAKEKVQQTTKYQTDEYNFFSFICLS